MIFNTHRSRPISCLLFWKRVQSAGFGRRRFRHCKSSSNLQQLLMADPVTAAAAIGWGIKAVGWVASPVISDLFKKCSSFLGFDASEELRQLEPKILLLERVMEMVADGPHRARLQQLFGDLETAFYEAEDILDDIDYHRLEKQVQDYELNSDGPPSTVDLLKHKVQSIAASPLTNKETGVGQRSMKIKKIPTNTQDLFRRSIATRGESVSTYPRRPLSGSVNNAVDVVVLFTIRSRSNRSSTERTAPPRSAHVRLADVSSFLIQQVGEEK